MIQRKKMKQVVSLAVIALCCSFGLAACAPQTSAQQNEAGKDGGEDKAAAIQVDFTWSEESDCSMCHTEEAASFESSACGAFSHASETTCMSCHTEVSQIASAHEGATADKAARAILKSTSVNPETCESCHALADIAQATAGVTVLTDDNGTVVNPHELSESQSHAEVTCTSCHQMHVADADIEKKAQRTCGSCHHSNVYECYTCHS